MKRLALGLVIALTLSLSTWSGSPQAAAADDWKTLAKLVPNVSKGKLQDAVAYIAKKRKISKSKALKSIISMLKKKKAANADRRSKGSLGTEIGSVPGAGTTPRSDSGGSGTPALAARYVGDIFVTTNGLTVGARNFGHTGIYYRQNRILHAPGVQYRAQIQDIDQVLMGPGTAYMTTSLSIQKQIDVAEYARDKYEGQYYNPLVFTNKIPDGLTFSGTPLNPSSLVNCSELVWSAYKKKGGIDLDGETLNTIELFAVFPWDIERSNNTYTYTP